MGWNNKSEFWVFLVFLLMSGGGVILLIGVAPHIIISIRQGRMSPGLLIILLGSLTLVLLWQIIKRHIKK